MRILRKDNGALKGLYLFYGTLNNRQRFFCAQAPADKIILHIDNHQHIIHKGFSVYVKFTNGQLYLFPYTTLYHVFRHSDNADARLFCKPF